MMFNVFILNVYYFSSWRRGLHFSFRYFRTRGRILGNARRLLYLLLAYILFANCCRTFVL